MRKIIPGLVWLAAVAWCQAPVEMNLPYGPVTRITSPDGTNVLYGVPYRKGVNDDGPQLWMENTATKTLLFLMDVPDTLSAMWSADSRSFLVQNHLASDQTRSYVYDAATLKRVDPAALILAADPGARRFAEGHAYFDVERWLGTGEVMVHLHGHTDQPPVTCFHLRYEVTPGGAVRRISELVSPAERKAGCRYPGNFVRPLRAARIEFHGNRLHSSVCSGNFAVNDPCAAWDGGR